MTIGPALAEIVTGGIPNGDRIPKGGTPNKLNGTFGINGGGINPGTEK